MIRVKNIKLNHITKEAEVSLFSDTKAEVSSASEISGLPEGYTIAPSSSIFTASGQVAFMKSDGTWNWV